MKRKDVYMMLSFILLLTSCGGSTASSNNPVINLEPSKSTNSYTNTSSSKTSVSKLLNPITGISTTETSTKENVKIKNYLRIKHVNFIPDDLVFDNSIISLKEAKGEGVVVGIFDSDFTTRENFLKEKLNKQGTNFEIVGEKAEYTSKHAENVLKLLNEGLTNNSILASSMAKVERGEKRLKLILKNYEDMLAIMKTYDTPNDKKVKIFNQSWGTSLDRNEEYIFNNKAEIKKKIIKSFSEESIGFEENIIASGNKVLDFYEKAVNNENALFIWANGNRDSRDEVITEGGLQPAAPIVRRGLEKGWISVVGVDGSNNNKDYPKHLAYSGSVSDWSISANGEGKDREDGIGSSYASPRVANTAVKVASRFSWMTNNDIRLVLFTTTNEVGVGDGLEEEKRYFFGEPTYSHGWGVLNEKRALKGPGAFWNKILAVDSRNKDKEDLNLYFNANIPEGTVSYFQNNILGDSGLKKNGKGKLVLTGDNSFSGKTKLNDGILEIYKTHQSGVEIEKNGELVLHNNSVIGYTKALAEGWLDRYEKVQNKGKLTLTGKTAYVGEYENNGGSLELNEGSYLSVLNSANLNNLNVKLSSNGYVTEKGSKSDIIMAKKIEGDIGNIEINGMRKVEVKKDEDRVVATVSRENAVKYLGKAGESSLNTAEKIEQRLKEIDELSTLSESDIKLGSSILNMSVPKFKQSTEIVSGEIYASAQAINLLQAQEVNRVLSNHLKLLDDLNESGYELQGWVASQNSNGKINKDGYAGADTSVSGMQFGVDKKIGKTILGTSLSYSYGKGDFEQYAGEYKSNSLGASLYAKRELLKSFYILGRLGATYYDTSVRRDLLDGNGDILKGKIEHNDYMLSSYIELGKKFKYFTPFIAYSYDFFQRGSFTEKEASWGIVSDSEDYMSQHLSLGIQSEYSFTEDFKLVGNFTHLINIGNRDLNFKGHFYNSPTQYVFKGIPQIKNISWIGLGLYKEFAKTIQIGYNLDVKLGESKNQSVISSLNLSYRF